MYKKLLKAEVKRLKRKLKIEQKRYSDLDEYNDELTVESLAATEKIVDLIDERNSYIADLAIVERRNKKLIDDLKNSPPKNYGVLKVVDLSVMYLCRCPIADGNRGWNMHQYNALRLTNDEAVTFANKNGIYKVFKFPTVGELMEENAELNTELIADFSAATKKIESLNAELEGAKNVGEAPGDTCNRRCEGVIGNKKESSCSCHIAAPCGHCSTLSTVCDTCETEYFESR